MVLRRAVAPRAGAWIETLQEGREYNGTTNYCSRAGEAGGWNQEQDHQVL